MTAVVINAAGSGTRLGKQRPKSLVECAGKPLIDWQLELLCSAVEQVVLVVGFRGEELARHAVGIRPEIQVVYNERWAETKTGGSLSLGVKEVSGRVVSLDGDLLVAPEDFAAFLASEEDVIGVCPVASSHPVYVALDDAMLCSGFSYELRSDWEWSGLLAFDPTRAVMSDGNVFEIVESILPIAARPVRCVEIDTPEDLARADAAWNDAIGGS